MMKTSCLKPRNPRGFFIQYFTLLPIRANNIFSETYGSRRAEYEQSASQADICVLKKYCERLLYVDDVLDLRLVVEAHLSLRTEFYQTLLE